MREPPFVSVIIPTYRRGEILIKTIENVLEQRYPLFEVIVIDQTPEVEYDQSISGYLRRLQITCRNFKYIQLSNPGLPGARNEGIQHANGSIILFGDDDIIPCEQWIEAHVANYIDSTIGGVAGRIIEDFKRDKLGDTIGQFFGKVGHITAWGRPIGNFDALYRTTVQTARGCNMSFRRDVFSKVGLFDERFRGNAQFEETDFCFRLRRKGFKIVYDPRACVKHLNSPEGGCRSANRTEWYHDYIHNKALFFAKNMPVYSHFLFFIAHALIAVREGVLGACSLSVCKTLLNAMIKGYQEGKGR
ncbi:MAG: glycosyltransferase family 2 protein [Candidatus Bathyarchaeia archaeon]